jgi:ADP-ribose pyrophosphatase YjhB (NUDIX family)
MSWRRAVEPFARPFVFAWFKLARGLTLGVRGIVQDAEGRILLIEHTYVEGWHLPGGGVEKAETAETALGRELVEEAGVRLTGPPKLVSIHSNHAHHPNDHVLTYLCPDWEACEATSKGEIARIGWFAPDALPEGLRPGHRRRIEEALLGAPLAALW